MTSPTRIETQDLITVRGAAIIQLTAAVTARGHRSFLRADVEKLASKPRRASRTS